MKKSYLFIFVVLTLLILLGGFFYLKYLKITVNHFQNLLRKELDSIQNVIQTPDEAIHNNCKYDFENQNDNFIKSFEEYARYTWNDTEKTAEIFLDNQSKLTLVKGGCNQYNCYLTLEIKDELINFNQKEKTIKEAFVHAQKLFNAEDYLQFYSLYADGEYTLNKNEDEILYMFKTEMYCHAEIYLMNNRQESFSKIKIGFTKC